MNLIRQLHKQRTRLFDAHAMVTVRLNRARQREQYVLSEHLLGKAMELWGALAGNLETIREARALLGIPWPRNR